MTDSKNYGLGECVVFFIVLSVIYLIGKLPFEGWHYQTGEGEHTGYVTSVESNGLLFKTGRAYIKTDVQSSQEDAYCIANSDLFKQLQQLSEQKTHITIYYVSWLLNGVKNCGGESAVIIGMQEAGKGGFDIKQANKNDIGAIDWSNSGSATSNPSDPLGLFDDNPKLDSCLKKVNPSDPLGLKVETKNGREACTQKYAPPKTANGILLSIRTPCSGYGSFIPENKCTDTQKQNAFNNPTMDSKLYDCFKKVSPADPLGTRIETYKQEQEREKCKLDFYYPARDTLYACFKKANPKDPLGKGEETQSQNNKRKKCSDDWAESIIQSP